MANNNDVFCMLTTEDMLDGTNYPLWAYMMRHVLVAKGLWNIVQGIDVRPASVAVEVVDATGAVDDGTCTSTGTGAGSSTARDPPPTLEQI